VKIIGVCDGGCNTQGEINTLTQRPVGWFSVTVTGDGPVQPRAQILCPVCVLKIPWPVTPDTLVPLTLVFTPAKGI
jgi:hypothetical protein